VLEAVTDPNIPPLPPHISLEQARALASALRKGDPDARSVLRESARQRLAGLLKRD
jgi:pyruvate dehydrogenase (quinone)